MKQISASVYLQHFPRGASHTSGFYAQIRIIKRAPHIKCMGASVLFIVQMPNESTRALFNANFL